MRAVILVGGFGTRLRPLTTTCPKQMLPLLHQPMIERVVEHLAGHGIDDIVLSLGYRPDAFIDAYPDDVCAGVKLHYAIEPEPLDTAGAVRFAAGEGGIDSTFLVVNGDVLTDLDVGALVRLHQERRAAATIALTPVDDPSRYGVVSTAPDGQVVDFVEKPPAGAAPSNWINAGTYVLEPAVLDRIRAGQRVSIERETFPALVRDGSLYALPAEAYWVDAGTPATYLQAHLDLIDGRRGEPEPAVHPDAVVDPGATVDHAVVMAGATVAAGAVVRDSIVLPGAVIEAGASVMASIVGPRAVIGRGAHLSQLTVVGGDERVAPGVRLVATPVPAEPA